MFTGHAVQSKQLYRGYQLEIRRELSGWRVGIYPRTPDLPISIGAAGFGILSMEIWTQLSDGTDGAALDPIRAVQGNIGGIGFLGAGAIIRQGDGAIQGATTGAGIWLAGCIGMASGLGSYILATLSGSGFFSGKQLNP